MPLNKLQNLKVMCLPIPNPYRPTSFKFHLMRWAMAQETFTKQEFFDALLAIKTEHEVVSKMNDDTLVRAWWNEFFTKSMIFKLAE